MKKRQIDFITMGCSKNLVDSEKLMRLCEENGYRCTHDPERISGEIVVINTCGFIQDAKQESIDAILRLAQDKDEGRIRHLFVMGCLSERYRAELETEIPQVDRYYGKFDYQRLLNDLGKSDVRTCGSLRHLTTPSHYAYLKISEGCDRRCAYCAIPLITGRHTSRAKDEILDEVRNLVAQGVKEFQIIAQELTYYGIDIDGRRHIAELINDMADIPGVEWIRLHYAYPNDFPLELLDVMRQRPNVCKYLDLALQHISDNVLSRMHRHVNKQQTIDLIETIRSRVPGICLRTTLMVGFPGETDSDFRELLDFVSKTRFERMGAFAYSEEDSTYSAIHYADDVTPEIKQQRLDELLTLQQQISREMAAENVGARMKVVVDRKEGDFYVARSEYCSPEVDPEILINATTTLKIGNFYQVEIIDSDDYDLFAKVVV